MKRVLWIASVCALLAGCGGGGGGSSAPPSPPPPQPPTARVSVSPTSGAFPIDVTFDATASTDPVAISGYAWSFSDGSTSTFSRVAKHLTTKGAYTGTVTVSNTSGLKSSAAVTVTVLDNLPPTVVVSADQMQGNVPFIVTFDASGSVDPDARGLTFAWDFGDGATGTGARPQHTYVAPGAPLVTVTVRDDVNSVVRTLQETVAVRPPVVSSTSLSVNVIGVAPTNVQGALSASDPGGLPLVYMLSAPPALGTATVNGTTGALTYSIPGHTTATADSFSVTVSNPWQSVTSVVPVSLNADPLLQNQWHIQNTGQNAFSTALPVAGNDMDVAGAWSAGYSGKGIKVGVVDSGLQAAHEDLQANVDVSHSYNFLTGLSDPTPTATGFDHGTQVSGMIGAVAFNQKGGRGVAYNATLRGYNLIAPGAYSLANMATAFGSSPVSADNDLFNASFGPVTNALPPFSGSFQAITGATTTLRSGLGAAIVDAAGNDFQDFEGSSSPLCAVARIYGVSCGDTATDERRGGYVPIVVAAINAMGVHSSYSNTGSSVWISAPGGEYGGDSAVIPPQFFAQIPDPVHAVQPAITTTALTGCANASQAFFNQTPPVPMNALDDQGANPFAVQCQYTAQMNGTSAATPNVSAVVAMMLEANPKLSVRDIKYILARTARRVDPGFAGVSSSNIVSGSTVVLEQGWVTNAAGHTFSNRYGFGAVDAAAAVTMAKGYTSYLPAIQTSAGNYSFVAAAPALIPPQSATGGFITYAVSESFQTVEFAVVFVNVDSTPGLPCNQIELTSPAGTKSILLHAANGLTNVAIANTRFESNAFYGEPVNGTWTLRFVDLCTASGTSTNLSITQPQVLLLAGH